MALSRIDRLQSIGTVAALIISVIAMVTSIYEAGIMKSQQKAMVWPYLEVSQHYDDKGFGIKITNKGTGPAIVTSVQIDYQGNSIGDINELMDSLNPKRTFGYDILRNNNIGNSVYMSGEETLVMGLPYNEETRVIVNKIPDLRLRIGYKSVLDEHWYFDTKTNTHIKKQFKAQKEFKN